MRRRIGCIGVLALAALVPAACGEDGATTESRIIGDTLTVYASVPLRGPLAGVARDVVRAQKLALREAGGRAGPFEVSFAALDSSSPDTGRWDPGRVAANARRAVQDRQTIAYLGELENGASSVSVPILNEGGILQVSPRDTFGGLTERGARGEPERFYPSGLRTFARMVPADTGQARLLVDAMRKGNVRRLAVADDRGPAGAGLADRVTRRARAAGIEIVVRRRLSAEGEVPADLGAGLAREKADAFLYAGGGAAFAAGLFGAAHRAAPDALLLGGDELVLEPGLARGVGTAGRRLLLAGVDPRPATEGAGFRRRFQAAYGRPPRREAVLGYDAMRLVLRSIERAGAGAASRRTVIRDAVREGSRPRSRITRHRVRGTNLVSIAPRL